MWNHISCPSMKLELALDVKALPDHPSLIPTTTTVRPTVSALLELVLGLGAQEGSSQSTDNTVTVVGAELVTAPATSNCT